MMLGRSGRERKFDLVVDGRSKHERPESPYALSSLVAALLAVPNGGLEPRSDDAKEDAPVK